MGGVHGDKALGMQQVSRTAASEHAHYLRPFARLMLALAALREKNPDLSRQQLQALVVEFPENPLFAAELAKVTPVVTGTTSVAVPLKPYLTSRGLSFGGSKAGQRRRKVPRRQLARFGRASRCFLEQLFPRKESEVRIFLAQLFRAARFAIDDAEHRGHAQSGLLDNFQRFQCRFAFRAHVVDDHHVANLLTSSPSICFSRPCALGCLRIKKAGNGRPFPSFDRR